MTAQYDAAHHASMAGRSWHCPRCDLPVSTVPDFPALSRKDNLTAVCSPCGQDEAMLQFAGQDPWPTDQRWPFHGRVVEPRPR